MLTAKMLQNKSAWSLDWWYEVADSGVAITNLNCSEYKRESIFEWEKRFFRVITVDILELEYQLKFAETLIATANILVCPPRIALYFGGQEWMFQFTRAKINRLSLVQNGAEAGSIVSGQQPSFSNVVTVALPDQMPRTIQFFLVYIFLRCIRKPDYYTTWH
jgi:hypothetical protein